MKKKIVFIAPHLSTGGMPQYLVKQIESIKDVMDVYCIEWDNVTGGVLVVQRNKVINLLGDKLITLKEDKNELFTTLDKIQPDIIHLQEIPELFMQGYVADKLYSSDRNYVIIETSHDSGYNTDNKNYLPDKFLMVSKFQANQYEKFNIPVDIVEYPIENKIRTKTREQALRDLELDPNLKHVINVGLFTPRKNQAEIIEYARQLQNYPIQFHFIGNQADNFRYYWEPLMQNFPTNCKWWNERTDVDNFYEAVDLFLFTSRGNATDHETMPLVIREALSWKTPSLIYNLPVYMGYFDKYDTIEYLSNDSQFNTYRIAEKLMRDNISPHLKEQIFHTMNGEERLESFKYFPTTNENSVHYGDAAAQYHATFILKELEYGEISISHGDVFVDLGGNIGMSSLYASRKGVKEIHTFEPDPEMRKLLGKNVPMANIHPYAISNENKEIELYHWPHNPVYQGPTYKVFTVTLRDILTIVGKKINYLKIDIEGFEETLFDTVTAEECGQIEKMMIEYHNPEKSEQFCNLLRQKGFTITNIIQGYQTVIYAKYTGVPSTVIVLYSNKEYEEQARNCIRSLVNKIGDKVKIVYFTIGFDSDLDFPNLYKINYPNKNYPKFNFYKPELCLEVMKQFPAEHYIYTDVDVLFSKRFNPQKINHQLPYPLASYGPHEYPFLWESGGSEETVVHYNELELMKYFNISERSQRYVWSCVFSFNTKCIDFIEEWYSMCHNTYLQKNLKTYYPFTDETPFNICLWKRNVKDNLGFSFVNTHLFETVKQVEETDDMVETRFNHQDMFGAKWEYIKDSKEILWYHGVRDCEETTKIVEHLVT